MTHSVGPNATLRATRASDTYGISRGATYCRTRAFGAAIRNTTGLFDLINKPTRPIKPVIKLAQVI